MGGHSGKKITDGLHRQVEMASGSKRWDGWRLQLVEMGAARRRWMAAREKMSAYSRRVRHELAGGEWGACSRRLRHELAGREWGARCATAACGDGVQNWTCTKMWPNWRKSLMFHFIWKLWPRVLGATEMILSLSKFSQTSTDAEDFSSRKLNLVFHRSNRKKYANFETWISNFR